MRRNTYTYDDDGHMLTATDARGVVTTYQYDSLGRATQRSYSDNTSTVIYGYDANGSTGMRTSMSDSVGRSSGNLKMTVPGLR